MKTVQVELPGREYEILIAGGLLARAGEHIARLAGGEKTVLVSDRNVWAHWGGALEQSLQSAGLRYTACILEPGEQSKSLPELERLYGAFAEAGLRRGGLVIAFGGGVIGDLAGFAAATWMRGVDFVQIPTTLLAQVDSSVGGKTAVNIAAGKNLVGAFHQPRLVLADTAALATLPQAEFQSGMAEVVKYGAIRSRELFESLAAPPDAAALPGVIEQCCRIKSEIVRADERESGERMLLNFGHTFGHAVEALGGFARHSHGQAVAVGMVLAARLGEHMGVTPPCCAQQLRGVLRAQGLETECPYPPQALLPHMQLDKKSAADGVNLVLLREIGQAVVVSKSFAEIEKLLGEA